MKLRCVDHERRVMVLNNSKVLHRDNGSHCETEQVKMGPALYLPAAITHWINVGEKDELCSEGWHLVSECSSYDHL